MTAVLLGGLLLLGVVWADEEDEEGGETEETEDGGWILLEGHAGLPSALDGFEAQAAELAAEETARPEDFLPSELPPGARRALLADKATVRARWGLRPWAGAQVLEGVGGSAALGLQLGHSWWSLVDRAVVPVGESQLRLSAPLGARGWAASADVTAGAWVGPVGLLIGPAARAERWVQGERGLGPALDVGGGGRLALRAGKVAAYVGLAPLWTVAGERRALGDDALLYDALSTTGAVYFDLRPFAWRLGAERRDTGEGVLWQAALGLQLRIF